VRLWDLVTGKELRALTGRKRDIETKWKATDFPSDAFIPIPFGPEGRTVRHVLIEEGLKIKQEFYLGIVLDRASGRPVFMASQAGGMDIEQVAADTPEKILKETIDPAPRFGTNGYARGSDGLVTRASRSRTSCAFGPGTSVMSLGASAFASPSNSMSSRLTPRSPSATAHAGTA